MFTSPFPIELSADERVELERLATSRRVSAALARRARLILALADGTSYSVLSQRLGLSTTTLTRWRKRFERQRIAGLPDRPRSGRGDRLPPEIEAKILALTQKPPPKPHTHWTTRRVARQLGLSHMTVHRVWKRHRLKPHRLER